jgi:ribonucleoside-diphosphate reductase alpha chain
MEYAVTVGYFPDGEVGEIFLNAGKVNSSVDIASRDAAIAASIALQCGASPQAMSAAMSREPDGSPSGPLGAVLQLIMHRKI